MRPRPSNPNFYFHNIHYAIKGWALRLAGVACFAGIFAAFEPATPVAEQNRAEPIRQAIAEVRAEEAKGRPLSQRMQQLVGDNEDKKKEYGAIEEQLKALQPRLDRYGARLGKYDGQMATYVKRVEAFNAKCGTTTPLPQDKYRACLAEKGELAAQKIELDSEKDALDAE